MKAVLKLCILMGRIHIYSYKRERLYLCSDIRSRGAKKYSPFPFLIKNVAVLWGPINIGHAPIVFIIVPALGLGILRL